MSIRTLGKKLREQYAGTTRQLGPHDGEKAFRKNTSKFFKNPKHRAEFSLRGIAEGTMGEDWRNQLIRGCRHLNSGLRESEAAIDASAFSTITGQILIDRVRENYNLPMFIGDKLAEEIPVAPTQNLNQHLEPWLSQLVDDASVLAPQEDYPQTNFVEQYIHLMAPEKRGLRVLVSMEMIYADKTKQAIQQANSLGYRLRLNKEKRQINVVIGAVNNWKYQGTTYNTYATSGLYVNKKSGNTIVSYAQVAELELLLSQMTDFVTGEAVEVDPSGMTLLCSPYKVPELKIALHGSKTRYGPFAVTNPNVQQEFDGVPLMNEVDYPLMTSKILWWLLISAAAIGGQALSAAVAKEWVFLGNFKKAFYYRQVFPFTTTQAPPGNPAEFNQDIPVQVKAMEYGVAGVQDPRQSVWSYNA